MKASTILLCGLLIGLGNLNDLTAQQSLDVNVTSLETGSSLTGLKNTRRGQLLLGVNRRSGQHSVGMYAAFNFYSTGAESQPKNMIPTGAKIKYSYHIPTNLHRLSLIGSAHYTYSNFQANWQGNIYSPSSGYETVYSKATEVFQELQLGYGLRWQLSRRLFVEKTMNAGIYHSSMHTSQSTMDNVLDKANDVRDFRRYGNFGWIWQLTVTLGCHI